jgi:hypothetical protein
MDEDGFIRQRRNLIVVSLLLLFADALGFQFNEINVLGNRVELLEPVQVSPFLWVMWLYLLIRYWIAFRESNAQLFVDFMRGYVGRSVTDRVLDDARRRLQDVPNVVRNENGPIAGVDDAPWRRLTARGRISYHTKEGQGTARKGMDIHLSPHAMLWFYTRGVLVATFSRSIVSEYYLPFVVAAAPVVWSLIESRTPECVAGC